MGKRYTTKQFEQAIPGSGGIITTIARRVGCSWNTAQRYIQDRPTLAKLYEDEANTIDDLAESVVIKAMQEGDIGSAKWWLERRRRATYSTRTELTGAGAGPVQVAHSLDLSEMSDDALRDSLAALSRVAAQLAADGRDADERDNGGTTDGHPAA